MRTRVEYHACLSNYRATFSPVFGLHAKSFDVFCVTTNVILASLAYPYSSEKRSKQIIHR